jgi:hypothetical protein
MTNRAQRLVQIAAIGLLLIAAGCTTSHRKECAGHAVPINDSQLEATRGARPGR